MLRPTAQQLFDQLQPPLAQLQAVAGVAPDGSAVPVDERIAAAVAPLAASLASKASSAALGAATTRLNAAETALAGKVERAGDTMTGALNVQAPATASNPLQFSSLPLSMTVQQALPLLATGTTYSFTVAVANAQVGQVVVLNVQATLLSSLAFYAASVTAPGVVTVALKAGVALAAATQTFYLRVLR